MSDLVVVRELQNATYSHENMRCIRIKTCDVIASN